MRMRCAGRVLPGMHDAIDDFRYPTIGFDLGEDKWPVATHLARIAVHHGQVGAYGWSEPLYRACGYTDIQRIVAASKDGVNVPGVRMGKAL